MAGCKFDCLLEHVYASTSESLPEFKYLITCHGCDDVQSRASAFRYVTNPSRHEDLIERIYYKQLVATQHTLPKTYAAGLGSALEKLRKQASDKVNASSGYPATIYVYDHTKPSLTKYQASGEQLFKVQKITLLSLKEQAAIEVIRGVFEKLTHKNSHLTEGGYLLSEVLAESNPYGENARDLILKAAYKKTLYWRHQRDLEREAKVELEVAQTYLAYLNPNNFQYKLLHKLAFKDDSFAIVRIDRVNNQFELVYAEDSNGKKIYPHLIDAP
ncbi:hypothetical protein A7985_13175 [Pseudoalteromonas luteoviolacea]|uniref:Uncharacterized protein n=1 Tax=Pseudoalteromonas luteoviolacea TaxID=43657 RepID=A0A1C0TP99_9GAMM|nr:hypothetical protein A7985_13175 [Pseudoalteromonas luteoviolacea]